MFDQFQCQEHPQDDVDHICLTSECNLPQICCINCTKNKHQRHNCIPMNKIDIYVIKEIIKPLETLILQKLRDYYDEIEEQFGQLKKVIIRQYRDPQFIITQSKEYTQFLNSQCTHTNSFIDKIEQQKHDLYNYIDNLAKHGLQKNSSQQKSELSINEQSSQIIKEIIPQQVENIHNSNSSNLQQNKEVNQQDSNILNQSIQDTLYIQQSQINQQLENIIQTNSIQSNEEFQNQENNVLDPNYEIYLELQKQLKENGTKYQDSEFTLTSCSHFHWARICEIYFNSNFFPNENSSNPFTKNNQMLRQDIEEGYTGNEILLSTIYLVASHCPQYLKNLFITKSVSKEGIYALNYYHNGKKDIIVVDDFILYRFDPILHETVIGVDNSIWILVLEKALAKLLKGYNNLFQSTFYDILYYLFPLHTIFETTSSNCLEIIEQQLKNNSLLIVYPFMLNPNQGFIDQFPYQITGIKNIRLYNGDTQVLMQMKNHQGAKVWKGDWSVNSQLWTQQLRSELKVDETENNQFYLSYASFLQNFINIYCYQWVFQQQNLMIFSRSNQATYLKVITQKNGNYTLNINPFNNELLLIQYCICQKENDESYSLIQNNKLLLNNSIGLHLQEGEYYIYLKLIWKNKQQQQAEIQMNGENQFEFIEIQKITNMLQSAFQKVTIKKGQSKKLSKEVDYKIYLFKSLFGCAVIQNNSNETQQISIDFLKQYQVKFNKQIRKNNNNNIIIQSHSYQTIIFKQNLDTILTNPLIQSTILSQKR